MIQSLVFLANNISHCHHKLPKMHKNISNNLWSGFAALAVFDDNERHNLCSGLAVFGDNEIHFITN